VLLQNLGLSRDGVFGVPLKIVALQDPGARATQLWDWFTILSRPMVLLHTQPPLCYMSRKGFQRRRNGPGPALLLQVPVAHGG
jgi:hypothetical protein